MAALPDLFVNASTLNRFDAVQCLVEMGWDPNANANGSTALHQVSWNGQLAMAKRLIELGADPILRDQTHDGTAADWAAFAGHEKLAGYLANPDSQ